MSTLQCLTNTLRDNTSIVQRVAVLTKIAPRGNQLAFNSNVGKSTYPAFYQTITRVVHEALS